MAVKHLGSRIKFLIWHWVLPIFHAPPFLASIQAIIPVEHTVLLTRPPHFLRNSSYTQSQILIALANSISIGTSVLKGMSYLAAEIFEAKGKPPYPAFGKWWFILVMMKTDSVVSTQNYSRTTPLV